MIGVDGQTMLHAQMMLRRITACLFNGKCGKWVDCIRKKLQQTSHEMDLADLYINVSSFFNNRKYYVAWDTLPVK